MWILTHLIFFYDPDYALSVPYRPYATYMIDILNGKDSMLSINMKSKRISNMIEQAFSVTHFQASINQITSNGTYKMTNYKWQVVECEEEMERAFYGTDGSWNYAIEIRDNTLEEVINDSLNYNIQEQFAYDRHISEYSMDIFEKLLAYLKEQDIEV